MRKYPFNAGDNLTAKDLISGGYDGKTHRGIDYKIVHRTAIFAMTNGVVVAVENNVSSKTKGIKNWIANTRSDPFLKALGPVILERPTPERSTSPRGLRMEDYGNYVDIDHGNGVITRYAHLDEVVVFKGQNVVENELIGYSDSTGNSTGSHLHFEIRVNGVAIDPNKFDYSFKGKSGVDGKYHKLVGTVDIRSDISTLYVRNGPATTKALSGSKELKGGTKGIKVLGFIEGELVSYSLSGKVVKTNLWWVSQYGNYFWSGGTNLIPTLPVKEQKASLSNTELLEKAKSLI